MNTTASSGFSNLRDENGKIMMGFMTLHTNLNEIVAKTGLNEKQFCKVFGIPDERWRKWNDGAERPEVSVCVMLHLIANDQDGVSEEVKKFKDENPGVLESLQ